MPSRDALGVGPAAVLDVLGLAGVDVLEVHVRDALGGLAGELGGVGAADEQVSGVQAQGDRRAVQHPLHLGGVLDHRADVRVQDGADSLLGRDLADAAEVVQQRLPALVVELGAAVVAVLAADRRTAPGSRRSTRRSPRGSARPRARGRGRARAAAAG